MILGRGKRLSRNRGGRHGRHAGGRDGKESPESELEQRERIVLPNP